MLPDIDDYFLMIYEYIFGHSCFFFQYKCKVFTSFKYILKKIKCTVNVWKSDQLFDKTISDDQIPRLGILHPI